MVMTGDTDDHTAFPLTFHHGFCAIDPLEKAITVDVLLGRDSRSHFPIGKYRDVSETTTIVTFVASFGCTGPDFDNLIPRAKPVEFLWKPLSYVD